MSHDHQVSILENKGFRTQLQNFGLPNPGEASTNQRRICQRNGRGSELSWGQPITGAEPSQLLRQEPQPEQGLGFKSPFTQHLRSRPESTLLSVSLCHFTK